MRKITLSLSQLRVKCMKEGGKRSCMEQKKSKRRRYGNEHDNITKLPMLIFIADCFCVHFDFQVHFDCCLLHDGIYLHWRKGKRKTLLRFVLSIENRFGCRWRNKCLGLADKAFHTSTAHASASNTSAFPLLLSLCFQPPLILLHPKTSTTSFIPIMAH